MTCTPPLVTVPSSVSPRKTFLFYSLCRIGLTWAEHGSFTLSTSDAQMPQSWMEVYFIPKCKCPSETGMIITTWNDLIECFTKVGGTVGGDDAALSWPSCQSQSGVALLLMGKCCPVVIRVLCSCYCVNIVVVIIYSITNASCFCYFVVLFLPTDCRCCLFPLKGLSIRPVKYCSAGKNCHSELSNMVVQHFKCLSSSCFSCILLQCI